MRSQHIIYDEEYELKDDIASNMKKTNAMRRKRYVRIIANYLLYLSTSPGIKV